MSPPRSSGASPAGKLDEISSKIGELGAYVHEHRHGVNNLSTKFDALGVDFARQFEGLRAELRGQIAEMKDTLSRRLDAVEDRIDALESANDKRTGALGLIEWMVRYWPGVVAYLGLVALVLESTGKL